MKVKELIEKAYNCVEAEVIVRENGNGKWLYCYRTGKNVKARKFEREVDRATAAEDTNRELVLPVKIINCEPRRIPEEIGNLEVYDFIPKNIGNSEGYMFEIDVYPEGWVAPAEDTTAKVLNDNQITIKDLIKEA